jgi:prepilin-type N-terminal cleavage/methylation domain-containing protein
MRVWKNERGLTLTELMAAVVILGLVAVPLTSLGTTVLTWYREDQSLNDAVLLAESKMLLAKMEVERTGTLADDDKWVNEGTMRWKAEVKEDFQSISGLNEVIVTVSYPPTPDSEKRSTYELKAVARVRVNP